MEFFRRAAEFPSRLGVFPGSFNPVTVAHMALARAALNKVDEVVFVLPRVFPHKHYADASFDVAVCAPDGARRGARFSIAATDRGLFVGRARCRERYGPPRGSVSLRPRRRRADRILGL
jgi:hypothetical protein